MTFNPDRAKELLTNASAQAHRVSPKRSPSGTLTELAMHARINDEDLAAALVTLGVTTLAGRDLCPLPNDRATFEALRANHPQARETFTTLVAQRPVGHVAATLRISNTWVKAAIGLFGLKAWPENRPSERTIEAEIYYETLEAGQLRTILAHAIHEFRHAPEAAWSIGVSPMWFRQQMKKAGIIPTEKKAPVTQLVPNRQLKEEIEAAGSVLAWATRKGIVYHTALRHAKKAGFEAKRQTKDDLLDVLVAWLVKKEYNTLPPTEWVSTGYIMRNVLIHHLQGADESYRRKRIREFMRELGFTNVRRATDNSYIWAPAGREQEVALEPRSILG